MNEQTRNVIKVLEEFNGQLRRILNIGFRPNSNRAVAEWCHKHKRKLVHLEAHEPNVKWISTTKRIGTAIHGDVRNIEKIFGPHEFDFILWLHGPEHVSWEEFQAVRLPLEARSKHGIMYQAPIGDLPQGNLYGNPFERHHAVLLPIMFEQMHYCVDLHTAGTENTFSAIRVW